MAENQFKMTYYIGTMLAQGGILSIRNDSLDFIPGALERAMGAKDTVIPLSAIRLVEVTGTITESLIVRTSERIHRFVGSDLHQVKNCIDAKMQNIVTGGSTSPGQPTEETVQPKPGLTLASITAPQPNLGSATEKKSPVILQCPECFKNIKPEFAYCPLCRHSLQKNCSRCFRVLADDWKYCPICGS